MASPVAHALGAYACLVTLRPEVVADPRKHKIAIAAAAILGPLADADFFVARFTVNPAFQHHYFTHSIPFLCVFFLFCYLLLRIFRADALNLAMLGAAAYSTHLLLDYFTQDGSYPYGIPLLWPFTDHHFLAPVELFRSIHRGSWRTLFGLTNVKAAACEIALLAPAAFLAWYRARRLSRLKTPGELKA